MAEITGEKEKTIKSARHRLEHLDVEKFSEYPGAKDFVELRYAENYLKHSGILGNREGSLAETIVSLYKTSRPEEAFPSFLIADSREKKGAWDGLIWIAQDLLRKGKPLPPDLAEWVADVLADQLAKKGQKRRLRPPEGPHPDFLRNLHLCELVSQLVCLGDLTPTRNGSSPPLSACDVVAAAAGLSYKRVERIWGEREINLEPLSSRDKQAHKQALMQNPFYPREN